MDMTVMSQLGGFAMICRCGKPKCETHETPALDPERGVPALALEAEGAKKPRRLTKAERLVAEEKRKRECALPPPPRGVPRAAAARKSGCARTTTT